VSKLSARMRRLARSTTAVTALVVAVGVLVSAGVAVALATAQRDAARQQLERRSGLVAEAVSGEAGRYVDTVRTIAAAAGAFETLTAAGFAETTRPLAGLRLAGATSIVFLVPVHTPEIPAVQRLWRGRGVPGLTLTPTGGTREHIFTVFNRQLDGTSPRIGIDATQSAAATQALNEARRAGRATVSDPYELLIDQRLPAAQRQQSFSLTAPVYGPPDAQGRRQFRGWVLMGLRGRDFVAATLSRVSQDLVDVSLRAPRNDGTYPLVAAYRSGLSGRRDLRRDQEISVADRRWLLEIRASGRRLPGGTTGLPTTILAGGSLLSVLLAGLVYVLATARARAQARVDAATTELAAAEAAAREQADLLSAIMDSISDGVAVVDNRGEFLLHNPAATAILGRSDVVGGAGNWQQHYGLFRPDGRTPFPAEEMPLVRALAGEHTDQMEMIIRNPGHPDGITITVSSRPLHGAGGQLGAVAVFHDITQLAAAAEVLRAELHARVQAETDLRGFAAVAAHDLKAPLAAVAGFAELLEDDLPEAVDPRVRHSLDRIQAGVDRMRRLIDDLLTYATARDGVLRPQRVDLQELVAEVIAERTAHLRNGTVPFPDIYTGPLPVVQADRAMTRQLLDNLVGNALKHAVPGQPARIDISARHEPGEQQVRIEIADRGVGIPDAEKPHVFTSFHRTGSLGSRAGTGLGLAICHRVIERHQATIGVADNPGGGTRIHFTLPAGAAEPTPDPRPAERTPDDQAVT